MGVFVSVLSKKPLGPEFTGDHRLRQLEASLNIEYQHRLTYLSDDRKTLLFSFSRDNHLYAAEAQVSWDRSDPLSCVTALQGYIWEKSGPGSRPLDAADLSERLKDESCEQVRDRCNGAYSVLRLSSSGECLVFNDRLSVEPVYYAVEQARVIVSNRIRLIRELLEESDCDIEALNWLAIVGYVIGCDTSVKQVKRLESGAYIEVQKGRLSIRQSGVFMFDNQDIGKHVDRDVDAFLDESIDHCVQNIRVMLGKNPAVAVPLTGGKDSRAVFALVLRAGLHGSITAYTNGVRGHPDVIIGRRIAEHYGVRHTVKEPLSPSERSDEDILRKLMGSVFQTDGMLGLWDANGYYRPLDILAPQGLIGEVYREKHRKLDVSTVATAATFFHQMNLFDPARIMRDSARSVYERLLIEKVEHYVAHGADLADIPDAFYTINKVPGWIGVLRRNDGYSFTVVDPLYTENLVRLSFLLGYEHREMERTHFEIINRTDSWLTELPFANDRWDVRLDKYAYGMNLRAQPVPTPRSIPSFGSWQYKINQSPDLRLKIWEIISSYDNSSIWDYYDRRSLEVRILFTEMSLRELIGVYGFLTNFLFVHGIEIPMKIQIPSRYRPAAKHLVPIRVLGSEAVVLYDGTEYKQRVRTDDDTLQTGVHDEEIRLLPHWCVDVMKEAPPVARPRGGKGRREYFVIASRQILGSMRGAIRALVRCYMRFVPAPVREIVPVTVRQAVRRVLLGETEQDQRR